jgi:hypothetical protein
MSMLHGLMWSMRSVRNAPLHRHRTISPASTDLSWTTHVAVSLGHPNYRMTSMTRVPHAGLPDQATQVGRMKLRWPLGAALI